MRLRNKMSLRSSHDTNNSGHLLDLEKFIGDSSKNSKRHMVNKEYQKLFELLLISDEQTVIDTLRHYKSQLDSEKPSEHKSTSNNVVESSDTDIKIVSNKHALRLDTNLNSEWKVSNIQLNEPRCKTERSSSSVTPKITKNSKINSKSVLTDSKLPRVRKSVVCSQLSKIRSKKYSPKKSIVRSTKKIDEQRSNLEWNGYLNYSTVDTNIAGNNVFDESKGQILAEVQEQNSLSVISSELSARSFLNKNGSEQSMRDNSSRSGSRNHSEFGRISSENEDDIESDDKFDHGSKNKAVRSINHGTLMRNHSELIKAEFTNPNTKIDFGTNLLLNKWNSTEGAFNSDLLSVLNKFAFDGNENMESVRSESGSSFKDASSKDKLENRDIADIIVLKPEITSNNLKTG